ncbi:DUF2813 domain-containing protein [Burkholderia sp. Bp8989]|uniref:ATP-dependent nuclease n=1 Tax=Burkholderia sp. Bp8989 TaxID=2184551 RepID=UPI000F5A4E29|nr:AAA family ATPase [Burkholderia sp. Bp8989]RQS48541.1 DUF2813 domain-containing protein [Burkholderia sp. Bp8989]
MHISKLTLVNYRNFAKTRLTFQKGVNTIIGENGSGKSNLFRAIRLLLDDSMVRSAYRLDESDFHRGLERWQGHWIIISIEFSDIGTDEAVQALFLHGTGIIPAAAAGPAEPIGRATYNLIFRPKKDVRLKLAEIADFDVGSLELLRNEITIADYETVFTGRGDADFADPVVYNRIVGDFDHAIFVGDVDDPGIGARIPQVLSLTKEVSFTFIQALRDVVSEFHNNRTNPLLTLLKRKSGEIAPATMEPIVARVKELNESIETLDDVQTVRADIRNTMKDAAGETYSPATLSIKSDLPDEAEKLFQSLRLFVGESEDEYEGAIHELSLGGANLIYLTLKLLEFQYQSAREPIANFLLIEEPEAHIHTHIQKTLFDRISYADTQIIYSTHSTHISEVSKIRSVNILGRNGSRCEAYQPAAGLSPAEIIHVQRYLDAVRSNLLFAKSVILVEGDAEEILIPVMFKKVLGLSLDELGVSLINVRSTGFKNVALLFHDHRIRKRCSIVTDLDSLFIDPTPAATDSDAATAFKRKCQGAHDDGAERKVALDAFVAGNDWLSAHYATHTFEVDFVLAGNIEPACAIVSKVYVDPATRTEAEEDLRSGDRSRYGKRMLTMAGNQGKGWFAILLGDALDHTTIIPQYIRKAVFFARPELSRELYSNIYSYRLDLAAKDSPAIAVLAGAARDVLRRYRVGEVDLNALREEMLAAMPDDQIHEFFADHV